MDDFSKINCEISFNLGPKILIEDTHSKVYLIEFYEWFGDDWALIYTNHSMKPSEWFVHSKKFRTKWMIKVWGYENDEPTLLVQHTYNETNKNVLLRFDYPSFLIQENWYNKAIQFKQTTNCNLFIETKFAEKLKNIDNNIFLLSSINDFEQFIKDNQIYATYEVSRHEIQNTSFDWWESGEIFENHAHHYKSFYHPVDWIKLPNEKLIDNILSL